MSNNIKKNENLTLYFFKAVACMAVIEIHAPFPICRGIGTSLARFAVPFFFMISGFFTDLKLKERAIKCLNNRIINIFKMSLYSTFLYLIIFLFNNNFRISEMNLSLKRNGINLLFFNVPIPAMNCGHLWYIYALLYVYIVLVFAVKLDKIRIMYVLSIGILISVYIFEIISSKLNLKIPVYIWRNFLFFGTPCFIVGNLLRVNKDKLLIKNKIKLKKIIFLLLGVIGIIFILELMFLKYGLQLYISSILFCIFLFIIAINFPNMQIVNNIGKKHSGNIYIIHYCIIEIIIFIFNEYLNNIYWVKFLFPIAVFAFSLVISIIYIKIKSFIIKIR